MSDVDNFCTTIYTIPFTNYSVTSTAGLTGFDLWSVKSSSLSRVEICEISLGQLSSAVANNQQLTIQVMRGSTALGGGATISPIQLKGWSGSPVALSSATAPSSNLASTTSSVVIVSDNSDYSGSWEYRPDQYQRIVLDKQQTLNVRVSAPPATAQLSGTMTIKEIAIP